MATEQQNSAANNNARERERALPLEQTTQALAKFGGFDAFDLRDVAVPTVGPRQVRVRVHATAINPLSSHAPHWPRSGSAISSIPRSFSRSRRTIPAPGSMWEPALAFRA